VQDVSLGIDLAFGNEAVLAIELGGLQLRGHHDFRMAALARFGHQRFQDLGADAAPAPFLTTAMRPMWPSGSRRPVPIGLLSTSNATA
jgi:hypothetical protein